MATFHNYSFSKMMLICLQRPDATHVAGFNTWKKLGRYVKKGEKGIGIIAPMVFGDKKEVASRDQEADETRRICFNADRSKQGALRRSA